jgi:uncharacterized membrane protein
MVRTRRLQLAVACALIAGYAGLSYYCNSVGAAGLGALLASAPVAFVVLLFAWRASAPVGMLTTAGLGGLLFLAWPLLERNFSLLNLIQETGVYCILGLTFGRSLGGRRVALCTRLADRLHGPLSPSEVTYTRNVTAAWTVFFVACAVLSIVLYVTAPLRVWSIYINFCTVPLIAMMFAAEYWVRRRVLPHTQSGGFIATVRVYFASAGQ